MMVGDLVTRKSHNHDVTFCIIGFKAGEQGECIAILKALFDQTMVVDAPIEDLVNVLPSGKL